VAYRIAGRYVAVCNCSLICPCPVDGPPTAEGGVCLGFAIFDVNEGNLDSTDLAGVKFGLYNRFPSNLTSGNWTIGIVVDEQASDEQASAVERIVSGQEGGPFGEFVPLIGEYKGMERASISPSHGKGSVARKSDFTYEQLTGADGSPTTVRSAMFGFAPEYRIGKSTARSDAFGLSFDVSGSYGESADYEFSTAAAGEVHPRA
jgi:hypothetical protein